MKDLFRAYFKGLVRVLRILGLRFRVEFVVGVSIFTISKLGVLGQLGLSCNGLLVTAFWDGLSDVRCLGALGFEGFKDLRHLL